MKQWAIKVPLIKTPSTTIKNSIVTIKDHSIQKIAKTQNNIRTILDAEDGLLLPGLINAHDHLLGTYLPKVGNGPYENWLPWDNDLKCSPVYQERQQIENRDLYLLGAYRNLVSGVTTVSDHIPHFVAEPYYDMLPMKAIKEYSLAHSIASFSLEWGDDIATEYNKALKEDIPFITHIAEGFDAETVTDLMTLEKKGGLGTHSVLVHGIAFSPSDMDLIKKRKASVVWCGDSNTFMFNDTTNVKMLLEKGVNVCIGTDSPMSGGENLLYEMKFDQALYEEMYDERLDDETILKMVTANPAHAFKLHKQGQVKEGFIADLTIVRNKYENDPARTVMETELRDVMLVVLDGKPVYGDAEYAHVFDDLGVEYQEIVLDGISKIIIGDVIGLLSRISKAVGFKKEFSFLPVEFDIEF